jgi:putative glycosyl hydrolase
VLFTAIGRNQDLAVPSRATHALLIAAALIWGSGPNRFDDIVLTPAPRVIDRRFFGMHIHRSTEGTLWPQVAFGSWRLWDAHVTWADLQPGPGIWDFRRLDQYVYLAKAHDVELLLTLGMTPQWASSQPSKFPKGFLSYGKGAQAPPARIENWREYIHTVATRYKGKIRYYEIWNEPNQPEFFSGTPQQMLTLSKVAHEVLKAVDSSNIVVSPSIKCDQSGQTWLRKFLAAGGGNYADVLGAHFYVMPRGPEAMVSQIEAVQYLMGAYGINKPLWNTEAGWGPPSSFSSQDEEATFVIRTLILNAAAGVQRVYWYAWDNTNWVTLRLTEPLTGEPRRGALAYAQLSQWLSGAQIEQCKIEGRDKWSCKVTKANGEHWLVLWNSASTIQQNVGNAVPAAEYVFCMTDPIVFSSTIAAGRCPVAMKDSQ